MDIYVYSDESGVFDRIHNDWFVFGGVIFLSKDEKDNFSRKYLHAERKLRESRSLKKSDELKATLLSNKDKAKLFRSTNKVFKFGVSVNQKALNPNVFKNKKNKQRYLDYVYKIALKRAFESLIKQNRIIAESVENIYVFVDEHTTATNGRYELREALEQEFKIGTFNWNYILFYPPIFRKLKSVQVAFCDSKAKPLIRAADIIANRIYWDTVRMAGQNDSSLYSEMNLIHQP